MTPLEAMQSRLTVGDVTYFGPDAFTYSYSPTGQVLQILPGSDGIPDDLDTRYADAYHSVGGNREFARPVQIWGRPSREQMQFVANAALPLTSRTELDGFFTYSTKDQTGGFFYRRPGVSQLKPLRLADGSIYDPRERLYPAGFTPQFHGSVTDYALHSGLRHERDNGLVIELSATYGNNEIRYDIENTLNPSLGPDTPTVFHPGNLANDELAINADVVWPVEANLASPLNIAFGFDEYRNEGYRVEEGDPKSYEVGPFGRADPFNLEITQAEADADPNDDLTTIECRIPGLLATGALCPTGGSRQQRRADWLEWLSGLSAGLCFRCGARQQRGLRGRGSGLHARLAGERRLAFRALRRFRQCRDLEVGYALPPLRARERAYGDRNGFPRPDARADFHHQRIHSDWRRRHSRGRGLVSSHPSRRGLVRRRAARRGTFEVLQRRRHRDVGAADRDAGPLPHPLGSPHHALIAVPSGARCKPSN